jgi:ankyrin repeat protein
MASEVNRRLCDASRDGDVAGIAAALLAGADPNAYEGTDAWTPLQWAAHNGHVAAIAALLAAGARLDGVNSFGNTPLMYTAIYGHTAAMGALLSAGADVNHTDKGGETALHRASSYGHLDAARLLVDAGARMDVRNLYGQRPVDVVRAPTRSLDAAALLHLAAASPCAGLGAQPGHQGHPRRVARLRRPLVPPPPRRHRLLRCGMGVGGVRRGAGGGG